MNRDKFKYHTTFDKVVSRFQLVPYNRIPEADEGIYGNFTPNYYEDVVNERGYPEIYQWYVTDCNEQDVDWLVEHFNLIFTYSELLEVWVLCVTHYGTPWSGVDWYTDIKELGDEKDKI